LRENFVRLDVMQVNIYIGIKHAQVNAIFLWQKQPMGLEVKVSAITLVV